MTLHCHGCDHIRTTLTAFCPDCGEITESYAMPEPERENDAADWRAVLADIQYAEFVRR